MNEQDQLSRAERRAKMLEKVRKLLAMGRDARGNANENETAMRQANKLMAEFGIAEAECDLSAMDAGEMQFGETAAAPDGSVPSNKRIHRKFARFAGILAVGVARFTDSVVVRKNGEFGESVAFRGEKDDVLLARWLFEVLVQSCLAEQKKSGWTLKAERNSFLNSAASALQNRLRTLARERTAMYEKAQRESNSRALVVVDRKAMEVAKRFGVTKTSQRPRSGYSSAGAAEAGASAGRRITIPTGRPLTSGAASKRLS